ncbi:hypothetical protein [Sorangium sp. So ce887]|uniref:hypothetical protein n=1 Tax=Sorangium sp. So ce887 TaxID=3133324 RepID=UPI003F61BA3D
MAERSSRAKRLLHEDGLDLYSMDLLPQQGICQLSAVVAGWAVKTPCDARRMPLLLRTLIGAAGGSGGQ